MVSIDPFLAASIILLLAGMIGSVVPMMPGPLFSMLGVGLYWWHTGFTQPGLVFVIFAFATGVFAILIDWFAGAISAKAGGASNTATIAAAIVGLVLLFVLGPVGILIGVAGTVFLVEWLHDRSPEESLVAGLYAAVGVLASSVVQFLLTAAIFVGFAISII